MASNSIVSPYYVLQSSFATGEISREVANRVDLDKYAAAMTKAVNCLIRPYGPVYKRPGSKFCCETKYADKACILVPFSSGEEIDYMLEIGDKYLRVHKQGMYLGVEVATPYEEQHLSNLRFTQSADTMFIACGYYPLQTLKRNSETNWEFKEYEIKKPYFDDSLGGGSEDCTITPSGINGDITLTSNEDIFFPGLVGGYVRLKQDVASQTVSASVSSGTGGQITINGTFYTQPTFVNERWSSSKGRESKGRAFLEYSVDGAVWQTQTEISYSYFSPTSVGAPAIAGGCYCRLRIEVTDTTGTVDFSLSSQKSYTVTDPEEGTYTDWRNVATVSYSNASKPAGYYGNSIYAGENWKIITHGTWKGIIKVLYSDDNISWKDYRTYTSNDDYNVTESGSLSEGKYIRLYGNVSSGTCTVDLTAMNYVEEGYVKVTGYTDAKHVAAVVEKKLGNTGDTKQWAFSAWCSGYGYPRTVCFFQDRLCLGGSNKQPYILWMSRTGDYNNFSVTKADGKVTDDSAVALSFVSRKQFEILHLAPHTDLLIYTKGNEWILSGREVVTPSNASPQMQTTRGCGNVEPIIIGNKTIFVQGRGSTVRDMGYSYETDSYGGADLTILDKQIVEGKDILDSAYMQEPNSAVYFVRDDGTMAVLSYVVDQKVYAWSSIITDGLYESVAAVAEGDYDTVYTVAVRGNKRYIEAFQGDIHTVVPNDYIMLDSAKVIESSTKCSLFVADHLAGKTVAVLGDGREFKDIDVDAEGNFKLPTAVNKAVVGLPYTMTLELPNVEVKDRDGTMQGRKKIVSSVILRLYNSLGGKVGPDLNVLDAIHYDEYQAVENITLYSGDKEMQVPMGGFNTDGRITVVSDEPYPFNLLALVRAVSLGG